jgi:hypothetical protein
MEDDMRDIDRYKELAADYDRMAQAANDQTLRTMYSRFAQLWRDAAEVELEDNVVAFPGVEVWPLEMSANQS